jgi:hypothetical protein
MTKEQFHALCAKLDLPKNPKSGTRKVRKDDSSESSADEVLRMFMPNLDINDNDSVGSFKSSTSATSKYLDLFTSNTTTLENDPKRQKTCHKCTDVLGQIQNGPGSGILRILLDTGASSTIILKDAIKGYSGNLLRVTPTKWTTMGGHFITKYKQEINFKLTEFSTSKIIQWICHIDMDTPRDKAQYDMIIGADLLSALKIDISYATHRIT